MLFDDITEKFHYKLKIENGKVEYEIIDIDGKNVLQREDKICRIFDHNINDYKDYEPPKDKLTIQVRRDKKEYPYLENLYNWANNLFGFMFSTSAPNAISSSGNLQEMDKILHLKSLSITPILLHKCIEELNVKKQILKDLKDVGYNLTDIKTAEIGTGLRAIVIFEKGLDFPIYQFNISAGMYRAIAIVIILNYFIHTYEICSIVVDDIGEGLDYERSGNLIKLIIKKIVNKNIQIILTSNNHFVLNAVDVKYWNIVERKKNYVKAFNYSQNKELFDEFNMIGLSNFDLFKNKMYLARIIHKKRQCIKQHIVLYCCYAK